MLQVITQKAIIPNQDLKVVSVPIELAFDAFPMPRRQIMNPIAAGKLKGQHHPRYGVLGIIQKSLTINALQVIIIHFL